MRKINRGFTLLELLMVVAITSIFLLIATDKFILGAFSANNSYNQRVDLQSGVKTSIDNVKSVLKKSVQVHLVGQEVYKTNMKESELEKLDSRYNYIGFVESGGNKILANIVFDGKKGKFDIIPLVASDKRDVLNNSDITYTMEFYKDDVKFNNKLEKNMLNITVKGESTSNGLENNKYEFELTEDILLPNINQILISRHLKGGIKDITAIAYDNGLIIPGQKKSNKVGIAFVLDASGSMAYNLNGSLLSRQKKSGKFIDEFKLGSKTYNLDDITNPSNPNYNTATTRNHMLGQVLRDNFLPDLQKIAKDKDIDMEAYVFLYYSHGMRRKISYEGDYSKNYLFDLGDLEAGAGAADNLADFPYGPYNLKSDTQINGLKTTTTDKFEFNFIPTYYEGGKKSKFGGTNTGMGLLQGLEILNQLKEEGVEHRFLILLSDGVPTSYTTFKNTTNNTTEFLSSRKKYNEGKGTTIEYKNDHNTAMKYIEEITNTSKNDNNNKDVYEKAFLIGFSGSAWDKSKMGFPDKNGDIPKDSINFYLSRSGNKIQTYDAKDNESLKGAFESIKNEIGVSIGIFDGPNPMTK